MALTNKQQEATQFFKDRIVGFDRKPANQFLLNPANFRRHPQRQRDAVYGSLSELGWVDTVIENQQTGHVVDGEERIWQALAQGETEPVPYILVDLTEAEEKKALAVLDAITGMAEIDAEQLDALLRDVSTGDAALQQMLAEMATEAKLYSELPSEADWMRAFEGGQADDLDTENLTFVLPKAEINTVKAALSAFGEDKNTALVQMAKSCLI